MVTAMEARRSGAGSCRRRVWRSRCSRGRGVGRHVADVCVRRWRRSRSRRRSSTSSSSFKRTGRRIISFKGSKAPTSPASGLNSLVKTVQLHDVPLEVDYDMNHQHEAFVDRMAQREHERLQPRTRTWVTVPIRRRAPTDTFRKTRTSRISTWHRNTHSPTGCSRATKAPASRRTSTSSPERQQPTARESTRRPTIRTAVTDPTAAGAMRRRARAASTRSTHRA